MSKNLNEYTDFEFTFEGILNKLEKIWESHGRSTYKLVLGTDVFIMLSDPETVEVLLYIIISKLSERRSS